MAGKSNTPVYAGLAILAIIALFIGMGNGVIPNFLTGTTTGAITGGVGQTGVGGQGTSSGVGVQVNSTTLSYFITDSYNPGTAIDVQATVYDATSMALLDSSAATSSDTVVLAPNQEIIFVAYDDGTASADSSDDWYFTAGKVKLVDPNGNPTNQYTLTAQQMKEGTPTITILNSNTSVNSASVEQTLAASGSATVKIRIEGPANASFGMPGYKDIVASGILPNATVDKGDILTLDYNKAAYNSFSLSSSDGSAKVVSGASDASFAGTVDSLFGQVGYEVWSKNGTASFRDNETTEFNLQINVSALTPVANDADINISLNDLAAWVDTTDTTSVLDAYKFGVSDETSTDIGASPATARVNVTP